MLPLVSRRVPRLAGLARVPGDKSISHRSLMLSSQVLGTTIISGLLEGEDVLRTADALRHLGVDIQKLPSGDWQVKGVGVGGLQEASSVLDMGNSGTGVRLMMGLVSTYPFTTFFTGDESLCKRPMQRVITPLEQMGGQFQARKGGRLPLAVIGTESPLPIRYTLPVASAQVKSAVMLAGLNTPGITTVIEPKPTRDHTERMLQHLGIRVETETQADGSAVIHVHGQPTLQYQDRHMVVPADPSSAAFPIVAALLVKGSHITLEGVCTNPLRTGLFATLKEMGAHLEFKNERIEAGEPIADIEVKATTLKGIEVPASRAPSMIDEYPILAIAAACAEGTTIMHGLEELRVKESDRLSAIHAGLIACGVDAKIEGDTLIVNGKGKAPKSGATVVTHYDHRIAMSFLVMGMVSEQPVTVDDARAINTSFPIFVELMNDLGSHIAHVGMGNRSLPPMVIAIDGLAASGKGTLARRLAEEFGFGYLDTGSLYRAVGMKLVYADKDPTNKAHSIDAAKAIDLEDLANPRLRQERVGNAASVVSAIPEVRAVLLDFQRNFAKNKMGAILDGRDIGTVVCPDADFKLFMTADLETRARRRHRQLQGQGIEVVYDSVKRDLEERDERDSKRQTAPLKPAEDAVTLDTSNMTANQVFDKVMELLSARFKAAA